MKSTSRIYIRNQETATVESLQD